MKKLLALLSCVLLLIGCTDGPLDKGGQNSKPVTGVTLTENSVKIFLGQEFTLRAVITPSDASNQKVSWTTSDSNVATVSEGVVKGVGLGSAKITVETKDGGFKAECNILVKEECQTQTKGPVTVDLGEVLATTVTFNGYLNIDQLADYDMTGGGVGFIYAPAGQTLSIDTATKVNISTVDSNNAFSKKMENLRYDTEYQYTIFLYKNNVCQYGETQKFRTADVSIEVEDVAVTPATATFKGKLDRDLSTAAITFGIQYSTSETFSSKVNIMEDTFSEKVSGLVPETTYYYRTYICQSNMYEYGEIKSFTTKGIIPVVPSGYTNLSAAATANCYIISQGGSYCLLVTKGNQPSNLLHLTESASLLWETFGTSVAPSVGDLIKSVSYKDGYIAFQTADTFKEGNAVIAAKDANGTILWSWHIWMTDQPQGQVYNNNAGTMMDRNLGATSATPGDVGALGLLYQWGRKDPFLGSSSFSSTTITKSTITWPSAVSTSSSRGTVDYVTSHPTTFVAASSSPYDWHYSSRDNTLWTTSSSPKSIYDPCPAGWRVPDGGSNGVWTKAGFDDTTYDSTNEGISFSISSPSTTWYPASGYRDYGAGSFDFVGYYGHCWSASPYGSYAYFLFFGSHGVVNPSDNSYRAFCRSVRCLQESK